MADRWCPNCRQRVSPVVLRTRRPVVAALLTLAALSAAFAALAGLVPQRWPSTANGSVDPWVLVALMAVLVLVPLGVWRWLVPRSLVRRCPLCGTLNLTVDPTVPP